ncbi:hypothetical protein BDR04DRAFT_799872 [Suillus decipiens]|nr:hypothetical protein BDR04DRAFT_799872 [Suillus decipiens]
MNHTVVKGHSRSWRQSRDHLLSVLLLATLGMVSWQVISSWTSSLQGDFTDPEFKSCILMSHHDLSLRSLKASI